MKMYVNNEWVSGEFVDIDTEISIYIPNVSLVETIEKYSSVESVGIGDGETVEKEYTDLSFVSASSDALGNVTVNFHVLSEMEKNIATIEANVEYVSMVLDV